MELEELRVEELLNRISNDEYLRQAFISCLGRETGQTMIHRQPVYMSISENGLPATESYQPGMYTSNPLDSSTHQSITLLVVGVYQLETTNDAPSARVYHLKTTNDPLAAGADQLGNTIIHWLPGCTIWEIQMIHWLPGCTS